MQQGLQRRGFEFTDRYLRIPVPFAVPPPMSWQPRAHIVEAALVGQVRQARVSGMGGVNHCHLHCRLAKFRDLMRRVKYGAVIG